MKIDKKLVDKMKEWLIQSWSDITDGNAIDAYSEMLDRKDPEYIKDLYLRKVDSRYEKI